MNYNIEGCKPEDVRYTPEGVYIKEQFYPCERPRTEFCKILDLFTENTTMYRRGDSWIHGGTKWEERKVQLGPFCVIGGSGFGYERDPESGCLIRMKHFGNVIIEDGVQIHSGVTIDRAVLGSTIIGSGTMIDNRVHIAHAVKVGKNCLIVSGTTLGGSSTIGEGCYIGMNVCVKNRIHIGKYCMVGMGAVVVKDVPDYAVICGNPAKIIGWQNENGERLHFDESGLAKDSKGKYYQNKNGVVCAVSSAQ